MKPDGSSGAQRIGREQRVGFGPPGTHGGRPGRSPAPGHGHGSAPAIVRPDQLLGRCRSRISGRICDPRHPDYGTSLAGRVVWIPSTIGSSSSSSVLAELIRLGLAPAALLIGRRDPILSLGAVVAEEMGYGSVPVIELGRGLPPSIPDGTSVSVTEDGRVVGG